MAKRKSKQVEDYNEATPLLYNGSGEYIITIPARDLSALDVCNTAALLDMSVGEFVGVVTINAKNKDGGALYIVPVEAKPPKEDPRNDEPIPPIEDEEQI